MAEERITAERIIALSKNAMVIRGYLDYQGSANIEVFAGNPRTSTVGYASYSYGSNGVSEYDWRHLTNPADQIEKIIGLWRGMSPEWFADKPVALYERASGGAVGHRHTIEPFHRELLQHCCRLDALLCNMHLPPDYKRGPWEDTRFRLHKFIEAGNKVWKRAT